MHATGSSLEGLISDSAAVDERKIVEAEHRLEEADRTLRLRLERLDGAGVRAHSRITELREVVAATREIGSEEPEFTRLAARLGALAVPRFELGAYVEPTLSARAAAVRARMQMHAACAAALAEYTQKLEALAAQLEGDRRLADECLARARADEQSRTVAKPTARASTPPAPRVEAPPRQARPEDRRVAERVRLETTVGFGTETNFYAGLVVDVSTGGLFVATIDTQPMGTEIDLIFALPSGERVQTKGQVCWTRDYNELTPEIMPGMGIRFVELPAKALASINAFVQQRDPLLYDA